MGYTFIFPHNKECKIFLQIIENKKKHVHILGIIILIPFNLLFYYYVKTLHISPMLITNYGLIRSSSKI